MLTIYGIRWLRAVALFWLFSMKTFAANAADDQHSPGILFKSSDKPPRGFEYLDEPQISMVDVYFLNRLVGVVSAETTPKSLLFLDPNKIIDKIDGLEDI